MIASQKLFFIMGKGGVGRTTMACSLARYFENQGESVLLVQWAIRDFISPLFGKEAAGHSHSPVSERISVMNYSANEALKEYFVDHLKLRLVYNLVLDNPQVRKLIEAAPGLEELFFLGRLYWLSELSDAKEKYNFDRIIVDTPATGHGSALFSVAKAIGSFPMQGPLVEETARVSTLMSDRSKTGMIVVTLPEELPAEESGELIAKLTEETSRPPLGMLINRSIFSYKESLGSSQKADWFRSLMSEMQNADAKASARALYSDLDRRIKTEQMLRENSQIPVVSVKDMLIENPFLSPAALISTLAGDMAESFSERMVNS